VEANDISKHLPEGTWENYEHLKLGNNRSGPRFELGSSAVLCVPQPTAMFSYFVFKLYHFIVFPQAKSKGRYSVLQPFQKKKKRMELLLTLIRTFTQFYC
jgi:hypothetical protein